jgi:cytoskeleton protein RodZ
VTETVAGESAGPGARLRAAREGRGIAVAQIAETLHVEQRIVLAMESDDFSAFDAPVYARGYLRKYASLLDLPPEEILSAFGQVAAGPVPPALVATVAAAPSRNRTLRRGAIAVGVIAALVLAAGALWLLERRAHARRAPNPPPAAASPLAEAPPASRDAAQADLAAAADPPPNSTELPIAAEAEQPLAGGAAGTDVADGMLEVSFAGDCWLEVYGSDGRRLYYDLGHAGESHRVLGPAPWRVFVGNVDHVQLSVNGQRIPVAAQRRAGPTARFLVAADGRVS